MGNHRADRRGHGRRRSDLSTPAAPASAVGKRRAEKPARRPGTRAAGTATPVLREDEETIVLPVTADVPEALTERPVVYQTSRIGGVRAAHAPRTRASQPGARRSSSRAPLFRGLPSAPVVLGLAALAISAGGAVTAAGGLDEDQAPRFTQASALSGASSVARVSLLDRTTVSRDSRRDSASDDESADLVDKAEKASAKRTAALAKFSAQADKQNEKLLLNRWTLPVQGYHLTARFGEYGLWSHYHTGLDFAADPGTPIHAVANGVVTSAGYDGAYGNKTVITLEDGTELWFCHQTTIGVSVGDEVHSGDLIGTVGSTGHVTGPHLHLEVRPGAGDPVDPYAALLAHGVTP
ncbi:peptidoglycan DD-metalloendopeptidase family protein [Nocardioides sp. MAH-18]|uniref:Peptidoglycan DD-metalloendopeptidase family protein n=1 Tax=Nocardioides agri TaxID=2682843 RepID=A0A6L6XPZ8_9ACTN|nr:MULTISPECIES: M23 family metallopeptidase [unclassified Nocardioides]MBA2954009.1 peptidoglycan DD-metalloendopeptidase family protein [Nocardioides sp. CGMCC 1.13656]MVQ48872.1 peptidoglycan DD-metalloendopeptidase family protein [Nocardioides sp. MAH-18]